MSTKELREYPNLIKAIDLLDESKYTPAQLMSYDRYIDGVYTWNTVMAESYDNGFEKGISEGL